MKRQQSDGCDSPSSTFIMFPEQADMNILWSNW